MSTDRKLFDSIMIDWETMGTGPGAAVIQLGAVAFDWKTGEMDRSRGYLQDIDLTSSLMLGGYTDQATVRWWRDRGGFPRATTPKELRTVLIAFAAWCKGYPNAKRVWCRGLSFDVAIAEGYYRAAKIECPWAYNAGRDTRTIEDLAKDTGWVRPTTDVSHQAREDCVEQIGVLYSALHHLRSLAPYRLDVNFEAPAGVGVSP